MRGKAILSALVAGSVLAAAAPPASPVGRPAPSLAQLIGQRLLVRMRGTSPSAELLSRIRSGQVGGIVLYANNIPKAGPRALVGRLQAAAHAGGQLPLLIAVDQEGGTVKRLPGPPTEAPAAMTTVEAAHAQGLETGRYLRHVGVSLDLAPVLDVPVSPAAFIAPRAFGSNPASVATRADAFAAGLESAGVGATAKHFPGDGRLKESTDDAAGVVGATRLALRRDLAPFRAAVRSGIPAVMVGTAVYPGYGTRLPAACSKRILDLLRGDLGFTGVTLSDDLDTPAVLSQLSTSDATVRAAVAGIDMIYLSGSRSDPVDEDAYAALLRAVHNGQLTRSSLQASYDRIAILKETYAAGA